MQSVRAKWLWVVLFPLACLWAAFASLRRKFYPKSRRYRSKLRIVCVGNIHSGGSGKTPLVKAVADHFSHEKPVVLARGYRGALSAKGAQVNLSQPNGSVLYGDEPWMLARQLKSPVFIAKKRVQGIKEIEKIDSTSLVILDDGFQHLALDRNLNILCINSDKSISDNYCLPLGELREPVTAIAFSHGVVLTPGSQENGYNQWQQFLKAQFPQIPQFLAERHVEGFFDGDTKILLDSTQELFSFCGVAAPERFVSTIRNSYPAVRHLQSFNDHHFYSGADVQKLINSVNSQSTSPFVTTDKDWYKAAPYFKRANRTLLSLRMSYKLSPEFWRWLEEKIKE